MPGFGSQPFGSSPYGVGTPATAPARGGKVLRDPYTGKSRGSRRIDPITKDYVIDEYGRHLGMSDVQQLVLLAVSTDKGTAAMRTLGHELRRIDRVTSNVQRYIETTLRAAVQHIVDRGLMEVVQVIVEIVRPQVAQARFRWKDLTNPSGDVEETIV